MARKPDGFFYDKKIGKVRPRHNPKGKGGAVAVALVVGLAVAGGVGGTAGLGATSMLGGGGTGARGATSSSRVDAKNSLNAVLRLERKGFRVTSRLTSDDADCVAHSYGRVKEFFRDHLCAGLHRALLEVRDKRGDVVLVAVAWVQMPDARSAAELKELVDRPGTGNVTELSRERGRFRGVRFTGDFYSSGWDSAVVVNAQAQPVARSPAGIVLTTIVTNAVR